MQRLYLGGLFKDFLTIRVTFTLIVGEGCSMGEKGGWGNES